MAALRADNASPAAVNAETTPKESWEAITAVTASYGYPDCVVEAWVPGGRYRKLMSMK
jgi:hypothetical protein